METVGFIILVSFYVLSFMASVKLKTMLWKASNKRRFKKALRKGKLPDILINDLLDKYGRVLDEGLPQALLYKLIARSMRGFNG